MEQNRYTFIISTIQKAGELLLESRDKHMEVSIKGGDERDLVTNVDIEINNFITERIHSTFPSEDIYSEEATKENISSGSFWSIDPIDGTKNFVRSIPLFSIVIAYVDKGTALVWAFYNPVTKELFSFEKGRGAFLNEKPIKVSDKVELKKSTIFLTTGRNKEYWDWGAKVYRFLLENAHSVRGIASSGLDICFVAAGRSESCIYGNLTAIDVIAAIGILKEAGGLVEGKSGSIDFLSKVPQTIFAVNNREILDAIKTGI
ncbi:MAG: hypothetical protein A2W58_02030 [Candidatus Zambryskibacteria bacterium RIFCSPHIGHO2_02_38_10.5]|uniref:Inositol-1-monophosphatase n=1 Tax=Candidatus Zambryskibacteria bacterium RIFCSPHIGHO2_02_38_10.5 TaxID=1802742 RepID=A0A1G2T6Y4_9BACT|nr:MAG: hypothetical protein A2W58_02030 [Candidatus Zambryskibacteria bacterium RIFCSPHIGHO2_02_38_10.5]